MDKDIVNKVVTQYALELAEYKLIVATLEKEVNRLNTLLEENGILEEDGESLKEE